MSAARERQTARKIQRRETAQAQAASVLRIVRAGHRQRGIVDAGARALRQAARFW
jgi:hypothetical protein